MISWGNWLRRNSKWERMKKRLPQRFQPQDWLPGSRLIQRQEPSLEMFVEMLPPNLLDLMRDIGQRQDWRYPTLSMGYLLNLWILSWSKQGWQWVWFIFAWWIVLHYINLFRWYWDYFRCRKDGRANQFGTQIGFKWL